MDKSKQRLQIVEELNEAAEGGLDSAVERLDKYWMDAFSNHGGEKISCFPYAVKAGEIVINESDTNLVLPRLKAKWEKGIDKTTSCYLITIDGKIAKIGALKDGVKSLSFAQYLTGVAGSPSRRSAVVYTFILSMLRNGCKVEVYHLTMNSVTNIDIPTINGTINTDIHYSQYDIEKQNLAAYKNKTNGHIPLLNFKERNATVPEAFDVIYYLVNKRTAKNKKYTSIEVAYTEAN